MSFSNITMIKVAKTNMGGIFTKLCGGNENISESEVESPEEFYRYLRLELADDEIHSLKYLFYSIKVAEQQLGRDFYKFGTTKKFRKRFKYELDKHRCGIHVNKPLQSCLMDHCFAIIWVHLDILKCMQNCTTIHNLLYEIAACHIHFEDFDELLQIHNSMLCKFIKVEFDKYTNRFTLQALERYLDIISYRIAELKEDMEKKEKQSKILQAAENQRNSLEMRIKELNTLRQIYSGIRSESSSNILVGNSAAMSKSFLNPSEKTSVGQLTKISSKNSLSDED